ncbi:MAG TPA: NAD(P)-dependent oxidoreductase [Myxococcales bacterium]|nr:NAD(P)-dependent oxidoreductase [Myxococcales bacterium]HIL01041.1 NAD(P)-dependent oxidoreductase [Myxococcales bacterium]
MTTPATRSTTGPTPSPASIPDLTGARILITGPTSQVALPVVAQLAQNNDVHGLARFQKKEARDQIEALGAKTLAVDLASGDFRDVPQDFDYVLHFAVVKTGDFDYDLRANAEGVGLLMAHCREARAFLHCSTAGVYHDADNHPLKETDPLGDNHRVMMPTYSLCKISAESVVRTSARLFDLPTTIARFSVPYGDNGGWPWYHLMMMNAGAPIPVHNDGPSLYNLIHEDDYTNMIPSMLANASVPATTLNWGGSEATSIEEWCQYLGELTGLEPKLSPTENTLRGIQLDPALMHERVGRTEVAWKDGIRRMVEARNPELLKVD